MVNGITVNLVKFSLEELARRQTHRHCFHTEALLLLLGLQFHFLSRSLRMGMFYMMLCTYLLPNYLKVWHLRIYGILLNRWRGWGTIMIWNLGIYLYPRYAYCKYEAK